MPNAAKYDPVKAHDYYERTKKLKGRVKGASDSQSSRSSSSQNTNPTSSSSGASSSIATVNRLKGKVNALSSALSEARQVLSEKRAAEAKAKKEASDGKSTVEERTASKKYRDSHKEEIASRRKESEPSGPVSLSSMSVEDLTVRVSRIQSALSEAKRQLSSALSLSHSMLIDPNITLGDITLPHSTRRKDAAVETADFSGFATRYNLRCSDGRTILAGAFDGNDGDVVPLVWQHGHNEPTNVLGHVKLEKRDEGMYCHASFNATSAGQHAKIMVQHKDAKYLSVWANQLTEKITDTAARAKDVIKGNIREVSLVLAGANPGAFIDNVAIAHGDGSVDTLDEAYITTGIEIETEPDISHAADTDTETVQEVIDTLNPKQMNAVNYLVGQALLADSDKLEHSETDEGDNSTPPSGVDPIPDESAPDDSDGSNESNDSADSEDAATNDGSDDSNGTNESTDSENSEGSEDSDDSDAEAGDAVQHTDNQEDKGMTHNVFDQAGQGGAAGPRAQVHLSHSDVKSIVEDAQKNGSLKQAVENFVEHTGVRVDGELQHGIENIDYLFPDAKLLDSSPQFISRRMEWVNTVLSGIRKSPFSRIKSVTADITPDEARARGYIKGNLKNEEFFEMSKRETTPQTIYKKQKLDRDDVIDIVDLDVVAWLKAEMKVMLEEELAGAVLVGDGRSVGDPDKIIETKIRPIATDAELYATTVNVNLLDASSSIEELVDAAIVNRRYYKGSGTPTFFTTEETVGRFLTVKDNFGRRIYNTIADVAAALRVREVVPVEVMERDTTLVGVMVNLADYTLGADKGGAVSMFDDFDLDYNKLLYLIETRASGALTVPKSALVFRAQAGASARLANPTAPTFDEDDSTVTVPTVTHVVYHSGTAAGATLTTGSPVTLDEGEDLHVVAVADSGYYFDTNAEDEFDFTGVATP